MSREIPSLTSRIKSGEFLTIVQLHPPTPEKFAAFSETIDRLEEKGVTIFDINAVRQPQRMDSFAVAAGIMKPNRIIMPHITARPELEQSLQQVNTAYKDSGIKQFLIMKGDRPEDGVFKTTVKDIIVSLDNLRKNEGKQLLIGSTVNQNNENLNRKKELLLARERYGADFFMSQLVFDIKQAVDLHTFYTKHSDKPLLAGIWLDTNIKTLEGLDKMNGIIVPETTKREVEKRRNSPELLTQWGIDKAVELVRFIKENQLANGVYIAAPLNKPEQTLNILESLTS